MKKALLVVLVLVAALSVRLVFLARSSRAGSPPGLVDEKLAKCQDNPPCVCSEYVEDAAHYIEPLAPSRDSTATTMSLLKAAVQEFGGTVQTEGESYLAATFATAVFGFVDDVEFRLDTLQNVVHIRSASRVGYGDLGVNRRRVEALRLAVMPDMKVR